MKKLYKNKQGFTLIELLVVIGILAVLAAIAIPSVAGLIDRANKSADNSNANEMTNAVERFVSEYELYKQDIASGTFNESDLDSAQGRVFNVTGIKERSEVTKFESEEMFNDKGVDLDSKYPVNEETFKSVVQNYMKTSSSTFEPKQSDMQYWYSPECGRVIVTEVGSKSSELTAIGFDDASINTVLDTTDQYDEIHWICLDAETTNYIADENGSLIEYKIEKETKTLQFKILNFGTFEFEEGMTWEQWITSEYNTANFEILGSYIVKQGTAPTYYPISLYICDYRLPQKIDNFSDIYNFDMVEAFPTILKNENIIEYQYDFAPASESHEFEMSFVEENIRTQGHYIALVDGKTVKFPVPEN